jgi:hypothetical protein
MLKIVVKGEGVRVATSGAGVGSIIVQYNFDSTRSNYRLMDGTSGYEGISCVVLPSNGAAVDFSGGMETAAKSSTKKTYRGQFVSCTTDGNDVSDSTLIINQAWNNTSSPIFSLRFKFGSTTSILASGTGADNIAVKVLGMDLPAV